MGIKTFFGKYATAVSLSIILLLALALRLYHLDGQSLWVDEIASMNGADPDATIAAVLQYSAVDQPPAYFLLLHYWLKFFPFSDYYGRLLATLIGLAGIVAIFLLGKEVRETRVGIIASLITSLSYIHIYFSQEVRFYTLVFLASSLSYLFFIRATKYVKGTDFILYALSTSLLIYTHYFGLVVLATQGLLFVLMILFYPANRRFVIFSILSAAVIVILILPWIPVFFKDVKTQQFWIGLPAWYFPLQYFYVYFKDVLSCFVFATLILYYLLGQYKKFRSEHTIDRTDFILVGGIILSFLIPLAYSLIRTPMLQERYTIIALPSIIVIISVGYCLLRERLRVILLIATCCTSLFSLVVIEKFYSKERKEDWKGMAMLVMQASGPTDVVVSRYAWYCNYYFKLFHAPFRALLPNEFSVENKPSGVWYLDGFDVNPLPHEVELNLLQHGYNLQKTDSLYKARASYYKLNE